MITRPKTFQILLFLLFQSMAYSQGVIMDIDGAISVGQPHELIQGPGSVRWSGCDLEVWNGSDWISLTIGQKSNGFVQGMGGPSFDIGVDVKIDPTNDIILLGSFITSITIGNLVLHSAGDIDFFIAKFSPSGILKWAKSFGGPGWDNGTAIEVDAMENIYVTGQFADTLTLESVTMISQGETDLFVAKFNSFGDLIWTKSPQGLDVDESHGMQLDNSNNIYITGFFVDSISFEGTKLYALGGVGDIFLAKFNTNGMLVWATSAGGNSYDWGSEIDIDALGNVYIAGVFSNTAFFDTHMISGDPTGDLFLAKYNQNGSVVWVNAIAGGPSTIYDLKVFQQDIYLTGSYDVSITFDTTILSMGASDAFIAKYDTMGTWQWTNTIGSIGHDNGVALGTTFNEDIYWVGNFSEDIILSGQVLSNQGSKDLFLLKYDSNGILLNAGSMGGPSNEQATAMNMKDDVVAITGTGTSGFKICNALVPNQGEFDIFLVKIDP